MKVSGYVVIVFFLQVIFLHHGSVSTTVVFLLPILHHELYLHVSVFPLVIICCGLDTFLVFIYTTVLTVWFMLIDCCIASIHAVIFIDFHSAHYFTRVM